MTEKEFWEDDPQLYWSYQIFYYKKVEIDNEQANNNAWLQGIYTLLALNQSMQGLAKNPKTDVYPTKPIDFNQEVKKKVYTKEEKEKMYVDEISKWARL